MSRERMYLDYIRDMLENAEKAIAFVWEMSEEQFLEDDKTSFAVIRAIEVIGEAAKKIPKDIQNQNPQIPWREITGTRNILIHGYFGVNLAVIWQTVQEDMPLLVSQLRKMLDDLNK